MSLEIPPGFASASFVLTGPLGTAPYVTTLGVDVSLAGGDYVSVANMLFSAYAIQFASTTNDALTISRVTLLVGSDGGAGSVDSTLPPVPCGNGSAMAPIAMAPIVRKQTATLGRSGRGRMFLPGCLGETDVDDNGQLDPDFRDNLGDAFTEFLDEIGTGVVPGGTSGPASRGFLLHAEGSALEPSLIIGSQISPTVGWIRKRLR